MPYRNRKPRYRAARRREMKAQGITPVNRQKVWCVTVGFSAADHKVVPAWASEHIIGGLRVWPNDFWLRPRLAIALMKYLRMVRVDYSVCKSEYKPCELCGRPVVGSAAEELRKQMGSSPKGRSLPCGKNCDKDREMGLWKIVAELELSKARAAS